MPKLYITVGPPGCGKSTIAEKLESNGAQIIERDRIRHMLFGIFDSKEKVDSYYSGRNIHQNEYYVTRIREEIVYFFMGLKKDMIFSDTFMNPKHLQESIGMFNGSDYEITIISFLSIPMDEIRRRNRMRDITKQVSEKVMDKFERKIPNMKKFLEDLDGVEVMEVPYV